MSSSLALQIQQAFDVKNMEALVLDCLESISKTSNIDPNDLQEKWESYSTQKKYGTVPTYEQIEGFRLELSRNSKMYHKKGTLLPAKSIGLKPKMPPATPIKKTPITPMKGKEFALMSSPPFGGSAFSPGDRSLDFVNRPDKGRRLETFNDHIKPLVSNLNLNCSVSLMPGQQTRGYRYLYEKLVERGDLLGSRIQFFAELIEQHKEQLASHSECFAIDQFEFGDQTEMATIPKIYIGRVSSDTLQDGTALNPSSAVMEASRAIGDGSRTKLEFGPSCFNNQIFTLYTGQIICVEATNPTGKCLLVHKVIPLPELDFGCSNGEEYMDYYRCGPSHMDTGDKSPGLQMIVVAGPFTTNTSFGFDPLQELADKVEKNTPDVVILLGPFVDGEHPFLVEGKVDMDVEQAFRELIVPNLMRMKNAKSSLEIILVPSQKDSFHPWIAYPQPPIGSSVTEENYDQAKLEHLGLIDRDGNVIANLFPNPVQFTVNEVVIAVSNNDILADLFKRQYTGKDKFAMVYSQVLEQRHFYPLFPPSANACLDSSRALGSNPTDPCVLQVKPDILLIPSKMPQCVRNINGVLCINPGLFCKSNVVGSYATLDIHALETSQMSESDVFDHKVVDRTRVEISKI